MFKRFVKALRVIGWLVFVFFVAVGSLIHGNGTFWPMLAAGIVISAPFFGVAWILAGTPARQ